MQNSNNRFSKLILFQNKSNKLKIAKSINYNNNNNIQNLQLHLKLN
jgi:hypothetical protein